MNGLVIVAIVFISLTIVPAGVLSGVIYSEGGYNMHELTVEPNGTETVHMQVMGDLLFYYDVTTYPVSFEDIEIYLLTETQYESWISSNDSTPQDYVLTTNNDLPFRWIEAKGVDHYLVVYNYDYVDSLNFEVHYVSADRAKIIALLAIGLFLALWITILSLYTVAYILKVLIIIPIFGQRYINGDDRRRGRDRRSSYDYRSHSVAPAAPAAKAAPAVKGVKAAPAAPAIPAIRRTSSVSVKRTPAIQNISSNYVVAGQAKEYPKGDFKRFLVKTWDSTSIAERVLVVIALFFLLTGAVTGTWYIIVVFPITLLGVSIIVYFAGRNRREKLIRLVESHKAIYITEAARILRSASELVRMDAWKIINLGLGTIGFDTQNNILFDASQVDPGEIQEVSPEAKKIHDELVSEVTDKVDVKEEKKVEEVVEGVEVKCPFCDSNNPPDSSFCIKCGASLKPAK